MRAYRWLLRLLPRSLREREGDEILASAIDALDAAGPRGSFPRRRAALGLATDVVSRAWTLRVGAFVHSVMRDLRGAARQLWRTPGFTAVALITFAIGIGANTTVFSLVNAFYFQPSEFPDPDRLVEIHETSATKLCAGCGVGTSYPGFADWRARLTSFDRIDAYEETFVVLSAPLEPQRVSAARVTGTLFQTLQIAPWRGRAIDARDDRPGAPPVVLLSHRIWQSAFGGRDEALGQVVRVNGVPAEIVGVMPPAFEFPQFAKVWLPLHATPPSTDRDDRRYGVAARLRPGITLAAARAEVRTVAATLERERPQTQAEWSADAIRLGDDRAGEEGRAFLVMLGAVGLVLAIACANLAALFLARATARRRELTVRAALGAGRTRLVRQLLTEQLVIGIAGGALGLVLAAWAIRVADLTMVSEVPYYVRFAIDWRVLTFCAALSIVAAVIAGVGPALAATRTDLVSALKFGGGTTTGVSRPQARLRRWLIVGEVALVLILLSAAGLMGRTFLRFVEPPAGYDLAGLMIADLPLGGARYADEGARRVALRDLSDRLDAAPGLRAGLEHTYFIAQFGPQPREIQVDGMTDIPDAGSPRFAQAVSSGYFAAKELSIVAGRGFEATDKAGATPVAIVNRQMATTIWAGRSPVGARLRLTDAPDAPWWTVVGVVSNADGESRPGRRTGALVYVPLDQMPGRPLRLFVRGSAPAPGPAPGPAVMSQVLAALRQVDADEPLTDVRSAEEEHARAYWFVGYFAAFYAVFGGFALLLAIVGVYGVVAQAVHERRREYGIRMALGADRRALYRLIIGRTLRLAAVGVVIGLGGAMVATRLLDFLLFGANPNDPVVFLMVALLLATAMIAASALPARRAARVDPVAVLRAE